MISFTKLEQLADECFEITGKSTHVTVSYWAYSSTHKETSYILYQEDIGNEVYATVQEIIEAMERIKNPLVDEEVTV